MSPNNKKEISFWHVSHIKNIEIWFTKLILVKNKDALKNEYIKNLSNKTGNFLLSKSAEKRRNLHKNY